MVCSVRTPILVSFTLVLAVGAPLRAQRSEAGGMRRTPRAEPADTSERQLRRLERKADSLAQLYNESEELSVVQRKRIGEELDRTVAQIEDLARRMAERGAGDDRRRAVAHPPAERGELGGACAAPPRHRGDDVSARIGAPDGLHAAPSPAAADAGHARTAANADDDLQQWVEHRGGGAARRAHRGARAHPRREARGARHARAGGLARLALGAEGRRRHRARRRRAGAYGPGA